MKKDNFDLRSFLVENRLTENSRGSRGRYHFDDSQNNSGRSRVNLSEGLNLYEESGEGQFEIVPVEECGDVPSRPADGIIDECDILELELEEMDQELSEAGYTDDEDSFSDPTADAAVAAAMQDKKAKKAFDRDVAKDAEVRDFDADMENDLGSTSGDFDSEEGDEESGENVSPGEGAITINDLIPGEGKKVEEMRANTEILVDLKDFFDEHPTYRLNTLQRFIRNGFRAIKEFGYREVLLKPQAIGYDINNRRVEDAVVRLTRPESVSQYGDAEM